MLHKWIMDQHEANQEINKGRLANNEGASTMSAESLIMSLLEQVRSLEEERDNARLLAGRMRQRLEFVIGQNTETVNSTGCLTGDGINPRLVKLLREVTSNMVKDLQQVVLNEEHRVYNLKQLSSRGPDEVENSNTNARSFKTQLDLCKEHYERLLEEAENEKIILRKKLKEQQDLVLDRDIKIKELESKLKPNS